MLCGSTSLTDLHIFNHNDSDGDSDDNDKHVLYLKLWHLYIRVHDV